MNNPYQPNQYNIQFSVNNQAPIKNKTKTTITKKNPQIKKKSLKNVSQNKQPPKNPVLNNIKPKSGIVVLFNFCLGRNGDIISYKKEQENII